MYERNFILTGGDGILGTEFRRIAEIYSMNFITPSIEEMDITEKENVYEYLRKNPKLFDMNICGVIHCAAYTNVPGAEKERANAMWVNIDGTRNVRYCLAWPLGARMIYISTDYVYPGVDGNYKETDRVQPFNFYAMTKYLGEVYADHSDDLIIRTSFKPNIPWPYPKAFDDVYTSADYVDIIAPKILYLVSDGESGIYNVGTERKSVYDLARRRTTKVKPMSRVEIKDVYLPSDISMNTDKFDSYYDEQYGCDGPDCCPSQ